RDHLDRPGAALADLREEPVRGGGAVALGAPHDLAADVVGDQREVAVLPSPADLVDPDLEQVLQPGGIELVGAHPADDPPDRVPVDPRSEEHTSELQSLAYLV